MNFLKENWFSVVILIILVSTIATFTILKYQLVPPVDMTKGDCWLKILNEDGEGFGDIVEHCPQTKANCNNPYFELPCVWVEEGTAQGCQCWISSTKE
jgi:hypothetical protein|tara:strand:+ start:2400 stop:2693 length:294 start_codon:yes stop_codon:yes gene_type:complete